MSVRLGIFGGTFDPPHLGHLILAGEAVFQMRLTRLLWLPTAQPPHKIGQSVSPAADRIAMVGLTVHGEPNFELSRVDIDRPGPHYTLDTLRIVRQSSPDAEIALIIGGDSLHDLPTWHDPPGVLAACDELGVMRRPMDQIDLAGLEDHIPGLSAKVRFIDAPLLEISSHEIRQRAANDQPFKYYLPAAVHDYIRVKQLYRRDWPGQLNLKLDSRPH